MKNLILVLPIVILALGCGKKEHSEEVVDTGVWSEKKTGNWYYYDRHWSHRSEISGTSIGKQEDKTPHRMYYDLTRNQSVPKPIPGGGKPTNMVNYLDKIVFGTDRGRIITISDDYDRVALSACRATRAPRDHARCPGVS